MESFCELFKQLDILSICSPLSYSVLDYSFVFATRSTTDLSMTGNNLHNSTGWPDKVQNINTTGMDAATNDTQSESGQTKSFQYNDIFAYVPRIPINTQTVHHSSFISGAESSQHKANTNAKQTQKDLVRTLIRNGFFPSDKSFEMEKWQQSECLEPTILKCINPVPVMVDPLATSLLPHCAGIEASSKT